MAEQNLLEHIKTLREALEKAENLDTQKSDLMGGLLSEVVVHATSTEENAEPSKKLSDSLREQVSHFEADHPRIAGMIDSLASTLSSLGI